MHLKIQTFLAITCLAILLVGCVNINPTYTMPPVKIGYNRDVTNTSSAPEPRAATYAAGKAAAWRGIPYPLPRN